MAAINQPSSASATSSSSNGPAAEWLADVARGIAPVKRSHRRPAASAAAITTATVTVTTVTSTATAALTTPSDATTPTTGVAVAAGQKRRRDDRDTNDNKDNGNNGSNGKRGKNGKPKQKRGQNHNRKAFEPKAPALELCYNVLKTGRCAFISTCKKHHDIPSFLAAKGPDLPGPCPFFDTLGSCKYGHTCRFAGSHMSADYKMLTKEVPSPPPPPPSYHPNDFPKDLHHHIKSGNYKFYITPLIMAAHDIHQKKSNEHFNQYGTVPFLSSSSSPATQSSSNGTVSSMVSSSSSSTTSTNGAIIPLVTLPMSSSSTTSTNATVTSLVSFSSLPSSLNATTSVGVTITPLSSLPPTTPGAPSAKTASPAVAVSSMTSSNVNGGGIDMKNDGKSEWTRVTENFKLEVDPFEGDWGRTIALTPLESKPIDFKGKLYLAPLTTVGNLPFRRLAKKFGCDITCAEMALCGNLAKGYVSEWSLIKRHPSEDIFGIQIAGGYVDSVSHACELLRRHASMDFVDLNCGCPIDMVCDKGMGSALLNKKSRLELLLRTMRTVLHCPITMKTRMGWNDNQLIARELIPSIANSGVSALTLHGRTRKQRYARLADWNYIGQCAESHPLPLIGNGDVYSWTDYYEHLEKSKVATCLIARGALIKPWLFTEIKERRHWDISSSERLDMLREFVKFGLEFWGSDTKGVEQTRRYLLEQMSFFCRYIPVGLLEVMPARINWRSPGFVGRDDMETLMSSSQSSDWVKISEMLLGRVPEGFYFTPKHKASSSDETAEAEG